MMPPADPPPRFKDADDLTPGEIFADMQARSKGEAAPRHETAAYKEFRRDVLTEAGLEAEEEADAAPPDLSEMTSEQHFHRIRRGRE